jgi:hypothetical protein
MKVLLICALDKIRQLRAQVALLHGEISSSNTQRIEGWLGPRAGLDAVLDKKKKKKKTFYTNSSLFQPESHRYTDPKYTKTILSTAHITWSSVPCAVGLHGRRTGRGLLDTFRDAVISQSRYYHSTGQEGLRITM